MGHRPAKAVVQRLQCCPFERLFVRAILQNPAEHIEPFQIHDGSFMHLAVAAIGVLLGSVLAIIGFAGYLKFNPSTMKTNERATFMFGGASIIGFGIWIAVTLLTGLVGLGSDVSSSIGVGFFMITTLIIFLLLGAVIGDIIGKDRDEIKVSLGKLRQKFIH